MKKNALLIRLDRLGDLVLTLPCDQLLTPSYEVTWIIPTGLDFVAESSSPKREFKTFSKESSFKNIFLFYKLVKKLKPDAAIVYHAPWWVSFCLWLNRVPLRGGVLSQWHSYLFLNKGLRQKRSQCEHHELDYNYLLTEHTLSLRSQPQAWKPLVLKSKDDLDLPFDFSKNYFVVHPGMGGSALNWSTEKYAELIKGLTEQALVVVTGTQSDDVYLIPLKAKLKNNTRVIWLDKQLGGYQLLKLLKNAKANIAPSTGVLHLSASLGAPSLGIFSPIRVHQDKRWGPKGANTQTFSPPVQCPAHFECLKQACKHFNCMDKIPVSSVRNSALSLL